MHNFLYYINAVYFLVVADWYLQTYFLIRRVYIEIHRMVRFYTCFCKNIVGEDPKTTLSQVNYLTAFQKNALYLEAPVHNTYNTLS